MVGKKNRPFNIYLIYEKSTIHIKQFNVIKFILSVFILMLRIVLKRAYFCFLLVSKLQTRKVKLRQVPTYISEGKTEFASKIVIQVLYDNA